MDKYISRKNRAKSLYKKKEENSRRNIKVKMKDSVIQIYSK